MIWLTHLNLLEGRRACLLRIDEDRPYVDDLPVPIFPVGAADDIVQIAYNK